MIVENKKIHVLIIGVGYIGIMASTKRLSNLIDPLINKPNLHFSNLIFPFNKKLHKTKKGLKNNVVYQIIDYDLSNFFSIISFFIQGLEFIHNNRKKRAKNILYVYNYPNVENFVFILFAKMIGYKIVFDIVEDYRFINNFKSLKGKLKTQSAIFFLKRIVWFANGCLAISMHLKKKCKQLSKNKFPVSLIPVSVNLSLFNKINKSEKDSKFTTFFYGGSFGEKDGIDLLLKAFEIVVEQNNNARLILTGTGAERHIKKLLNLLSRSKCKNNIDYLGYLSNSQYYQVLNDCDVMCMARVNSPFANAGFPFKLGEFLATGKTVICTPVGDVPRYLTHMKNSIFVKPGNEISIAQAMLYCIQNPKLCKNIGKNGRKVAEEHFDSIKVSDKLLNFFQII